MYRRPLRRRSPYSRHRSHHARSHSSYSYGYKRSPTPSSSSSPQLAYRSRSKSPSDQRKKSHHHAKRSASSRHSSRRETESPRREAGGSENPYGQHGERDGSLNPEQQRYLQWEREYKEWCEKYFSSYVSHFHQPPPAPFHLNPAALTPRQERAGGQHVNREHRPHGRRSAQQGDRSPPSRSSSDSDSTASQSASDSRSSPSPVPSPRSQSSNDGPETPPEAKDLERGLAAGMQKSLPVALMEESDDSELPEGRREERQRVTKTYENSGASKHRRRPKKDQEGREGCSYSKPAGSVADDRRDQRSHGSGEDNSPRREAAKSDKDHEIKRNRRNRDSAKEKCSDGGGHSDSRHDGQGQDKRRPSKERVRSDKGKYERPRGKSASDSRSERSEKRKRQEKSSSLPHKTDKSDELQTWRSESHDQPDKKEKKERQTRPVTDGHIWEGGMKVKAQKKISINISLDTRRRDVKADDNEQIYLEDATGKTGGEHESPQDGGGGGDVMEKEEDGNRDKKEPVGIWDVTSSGDHKEQTEEETSGGNAAEDSRLRALGAAEEEPQAEKRRWEDVLTTSGGKKWRSIEGGNAEALTATGEEDEETRKNLHGGPQVSGGDVRSEFSPGIQFKSALK